MTSSTVSGSPSRTSTRPWVEMRRKSCMRRRRCEGKAPSAVGPGQVELCNDGPVTVELVSSPTPSIASPTPRSTKSAVTAATKKDEDLEAILGQQPYLGGLLGHATERC
eukprot:Skav226791  [mRNA]  locus=scaffold8:442881:444260:+ [translate_table: standard]